MPKHLPKPKHKHNLRSLLDPPVQFVDSLFTYNCGPYWSDGVIQPSVAHFSTDPVNDLDYSCMMHDREYALATDDEMRREADDKFYKINRNKSIQRRIYANLVKHQDKMSWFLAPFIMALGGLYYEYKYLEQNYPTQNKLRGSVTDPTVTTPTGTTLAQPNTEDASSGVGFDVNATAPTMHSPSIIEAEVVKNVQSPGAVPSGSPVVLYDPYFGDFARNYKQLNKRKRQHAQTNSTPKRRKIKQVRTRVNDFHCSC